MQYAYTSVVITDNTHYNSDEYFLKSTHYNIVLHTYLIIVQFISTDIWLLFFTIILMTNFTQLQPNFKNQNREVSTHIGTYRQRRQILEMSWGSLFYKYM